MTGRDIDNLLEAYLRSDEAAATRPPAVGLAPTAEPEATPPRAAPEGGRASQAELRELLARYLDTFSGEAGDESGREFALPRSAEVDELLRRHVVDNEDVKDELIGSLRGHLEAAPRDGGEPEAGGSAHWALRAAATQQAALTLDERLERYAQAYAENEEQAHAFTPDSSTIKGVPPPNSPPIPARGSVAKRREPPAPPGPNRSR